MRDSRITTGRAATHPAADIETVVVDPNDIVETFERNAEEENQLRTHVLRLTPPFDDEVRAEPYVQEGPKRYPPGGGPDPLHLEPATFVRNENGVHPNETHIAVPTRQRAREAAREDHGNDVDGETVEEYYESVLDEWENRVRSSLIDTIRVYFDPETGDEIWTDVRYEATND